MQPKRDVGLTSQHSPDRWGIVVCGLLVAAGVAVYTNSFHGVFLFDDLKEIVDNERIRRLWPPLELLGGRRPVVDLTLAINYALGMLNEWGFHAVNVAVHILASITLYGLVRRTLEHFPFSYATSAALRGPSNSEKPRGLKPAARNTETGNALARQTSHDHIQNNAGSLAFTIALLWLIHPLQTQSVTYLIQRAEALMGLFYLLTLYCVLRGAESARGGSWYLLSVLTCALGMGSKAVMVTAPVTVFLFDGVFLARSFGAALRQRWSLYVGLAATWIILILCGVAGGVLNPAKTGGTVGLGFIGATPWEYALTQPGVLLHYVKISLWPNPLCLDYGWPLARSAQEIVGPAVVLAIVLAGTTWALLRKSWFGFVGAWFFVILSPTSSVIPIQDAAFEHRMYLPLATVISLAVLGVWWAVGLLSARYTASPAIRRVIAGSLIASAAIPLGYLTVDRNRDYRSALIMWRDVVTNRRANPRGYYNLGKAFDEAGQETEAMRLYQQATEVDPVYDEAYFGLGVLLARRGRLGDAVEAYRQAIRLHPRNASVRSNLGNTLVKLGRFDEAVAEYEEALRIAPRHVNARYNLGSTWLHLGRFVDAIRAFREVLRIQPDHLPARCNLGVTLADSGRLDEAIQVYREVLRIDSRHANTYANLGIAFLLQGKREEGIAALRRVLVIEPDHEVARRALQSTWPSETRP